MLAKRQRLFTLGAAIAVVAAMPALSLAAKPIVKEHTRFITAPHPANFCGVPGTAFETVHEHFRTFEGGDRGMSQFTQIFTAAATGRSIESSGTDAASLNITDNGDGTVTLVFKSSGLALQFRIPNGPVFKLADGGPIRSAGIVTVTQTVDVATGETLSFTVVEHGPHLLMEGADVCGPVIDYLTGA
jgi:hypothetical protein